jgi:mannose-6-phosphate isomerase-like protein (cupin superfamily)
MGKAGELIEFQGTGERILVIQVGDDARGEPFQAELTVAPHGLGPPEHIHPRIEETFEVRSGRLHVRVRSEDHVIGPGERVVVPPGTPHKFWNEADEEARALLQESPALRLLTFHETIYGVQNAGKANLLQIAVIAREYRPEVYPARPSLPIQKVIFGILAPIGKLVGYRARYAEYSGPE